MSRPRLIALLLAFATLLVYLPVGRYSFVNYDDTDYVTENSFVKNGLTGTDIHWAFTAFHAGNWHPLTWLSHMLDCQLFGPNAGAHHFMNVLWHAVNVALLFLWLTQLTGRMGPAAFIAALFAWHPLHVESVAWISERKDVLSTFFGLLTLIAYTHHTQAHDRRFLWLALVCFALGLLAKPMLVTLPCVLLLLDYWPLQRLTPLKAAVWLEKLPFFALTVASCVVTFLAQRQGEAVISLTAVPLKFRLENAPVAVMEYLGKLFVPINLSVIYPIQSRYLPGLEVALAVGALVAISVMGWRWRLSRPYFLMGWLWFLGTLVPVIGLVQVGGQTMADRYMYFPSIGFFIAMVFVMLEVAERLETPRVIQTGAATVISAMCILGTERQLPNWQDSETLFRHAVAVTKNNDVALVNLGVALDVQGRYDESLPIYQQAEKLNHGRYQLHNNLGNILSKLGRHAEALEEYREAIRLRPNDAGFHNSAGIELAALGKNEDALKEYDEADRLDPQFPWTHMERAKLFFGEGRDGEAIEELHKGLQMAPDDYEILATTARYLAANANPAARDGKLAVALASKANTLSGNSQPVVMDALGMALAESGDFTNAQRYAENALALALAVHFSKTNEMQQRLDFYKMNRPWRESFRTTNSVAP